MFLIVSENLEFKMNDLRLPRTLGDVCQFPFEINPKLFGVIKGGEEQVEPEND